MLLKKERVREDKKTRSWLSLFALFAFGLPPPPPPGLSLSLSLSLSSWLVAEKKKNL